MPTPDELLRDRLMKALDRRQREVCEARNWYDGKHPIPRPRPYTLPDVDQQARAAYENMCREGIMNWIRPVVNAPAAKCKVEGLRFGATPMGSDQDLWRIWQRNHLNADSLLAITDALKVGTCPVLVWYGDTDSDGNRQAEITVEDPEQVIVAYEAGSRRKRAAALKRWVEDDGYTYVTLYTPTAINYWKSTKTADTKVYDADTVGEWSVRKETLPNPLGIVPMFELRANPTTKAMPFGGGCPEFAGVINDQKRINRHVFYMLNTEEAQSFRQRWATDWDYPQLPDGTPDREKMIRFAASGMAAFNSDPDGAQPVQVGEFGQADFRPFVDILRMEITHFAAATDTPPNAFLIVDMANIADAAAATIKSAFLSKCANHQTNFGEDLEEILQAALKVEGNPNAGDYTLTVDWENPDQPTMADQNTTATTMLAVGAPQEAVFAALPGVDRTEAARWMVELEAQRLSALEAPVAVP